MTNPPPVAVAPHSPACIQPHEGSLLRRMFLPLNIAAYVTWAVVGLAILEPDALRAGNPREWSGLAFLLVFLACFVVCASAPGNEPTRRAIALACLQGVLVVAAEWCLRGGQTPVLLIIAAVQIVAVLPQRLAIAYLVSINAAIAWIWVGSGFSPRTVILSLTSIVGFQVFAALTGHYAISRERAREHLARVNAELLATRRLLEESARAGERLKLSRELHDVAGHSLTALKLNLARLARDPALAEREELRASAALADELLGQIRQVVSALRVHDGLDLRAALEALALPVPGTRIEIDVEEGLRVDDVDHAEAVLRSAQEAITNALRHGRATRIDVRLCRRDGALELTIDNDGASPTRLAPGHGLTGMRERLAAIGGTLALEPIRPRGLRVHARIPAFTAAGTDA